MLKKVAVLICLILFIVVLLFSKKVKQDPFLYYAVPLQRVNHGFEFGLFNFELPEQAPNIPQKTPVKQEVPKIDRSLFDFSGCGPKPSDPDYSYSRLFKEDKRKKKCGKIKLNIAL